MISRPAGQPSQVAPVQALRAFAALAVAILHIQGEAGAMAGTPGQSPWPWLARFPWEAGVDLFFVISGFVMVYASRPLFGAPHGGRIFLRRRLARIVPLYWAVTTVFLLGAVFAPVVLHDPFGSWPMVVTSYLFVPWQRPDGSFLPVFRLGWTLNYEMLFYVIFSAAIAQPMRRCVAVVSGFLIIAALAGQLMPPSIPQWVFWSDPIVLEFVLGMAAGQFVVEGGRVPPAGWLLGVAGLGILAFNPMAFGVPRWIAFGGPALAMLLACLVPVRDSRWLMLLTSAGAASYALYLTHLFSARALREIWVRAAGPAFLGAYAFAAIAVTLAVSLLIHRCFEVPATRVARRILGVAS